MHPPAPIWKHSKAKAAFLDRPAPMYDSLAPDDMLSTYYEDHPNDALSNYIAGFAVPWGVGQSMSCGIPAACYPRLNCQDLNPNNVPGSASAYAILLSFQNFNEYLNLLFQGLYLGYGVWSGIQVKLQQTYFPAPVASPVIKEILNGLAAIVGIIGASSGVIGAGTAAVAGSGAALVAGIVGGVNLALPTVDYNIQYVAELEVNAQAWYDAVFQEIVWANNNFTSTSFWSGATLGDIIDHGAWLDSTDHPLLNTDARKPRVSIDDIKNVFKKNILAQTINYAWKQQGTFIVKWDMSEDEYNAQGNNWKPGNGDFRFRTYYGGSAFFLQRITDPDPNVSPTNAYPPGWGSVSTDLAPCDTICMMQSAADGWHDYGFNYNFTMSTGLYDSTDQSTALGIFNNIPRSRGFFNVPVCDLSGNSHVPDLATLQGLLADQNKNVGSCDATSLLCYCLGITDSHGTKFSDMMPKALVDDMNAHNCLPNAYDVYCGGSSGGAAGT